MTLSEYLIKNNQKISTLAKALGVRHCVARWWVIGKVIPKKENMLKIVRYTKGEVTPEDFYGLKELDTKK